MQMARGPIRKVIKHEVKTSIVNRGSVPNREVHRHWDVLECGHVLRCRDNRPTMVARRCEECLYGQLKRHG